MRLSHFLISRPIFAIVLSLFVTIVRAVAYFALPVAQYPEVAPPTIQVTASYPGASAEVLSNALSRAVSVRAGTSPPRASPA